MFHSVLCAKADGTVVSYLYKCREYLGWLKMHGFSSKFPDNEKIIAAYFEKKFENAKSDSTVITTSSAIKWLYSLINSKQNPVDSPIVQQIILSHKRSLHKSPVQKEPLSLEQVKAIVQKFASPESSLMQLRTACYVTFQFSLLFRHDEMAQVKANHLELLPNDLGISVFIPRSKTDIFRDGDKTYLSTTGKEFCPVKILQRYMAECNIEMGDDSFLFSPLSYHASSNSYKPLTTKALSYSRCREIFLDALKQINVICPQKYGLHSLRSGGASHLANKGLSEELIMIQGRWKTSQSKNRYVKRSLNTRLEISKMTSSDCRGHMHCMQLCCVDPLNVRYQ